MPNKMVVLLDGVAQLEFDRDKPLPDHQALYLDKMDAKMAAGIELDGQSLPEPDLGQRAQFVAANLAHAIVTDDEQTAAATCTYLAVRLPDLKQVKIDRRGEDFSIHLVFDEAHANQVPVQFTRLQ